MIYIYIYIYIYTFVYLYIHGLYDMKGSILNLLFNDLNHCFLMPSICASMGFGVATRLGLPGMPSLSMLPGTRGMFGNGSAFSKAILGNWSKNAMAISYG